MLTLREHQIQALQQLSTGKILCGGVGSGKSLTSLAYFYQQNGGSLHPTFQHMKKKPLDLYIITIAKKRNDGEWEKELNTLRMSTDPKINYYDHKVVVDSWNNIRKYEDVTDAFFIFDEDKITGYGAWARSFLKITKPKANNQWIVLSATPGDTWSDYMTVFIANGFYRNKSDFVQQHVIYSPHTDFPKIDGYINTGKLIKERRDILVDMDFQRSAVHVKHNIYVDYDKIAYKQVFKTRKNPFDNNSMIDNVSALCYVLRHVVNADPTRVEAVQKIVQEHHKVIIFYNFTYELELLRSLDYGEGYDISEWNGHNHEPIPNSDKWVYLVQYSACEGWNCITTDTVIFYSQNYSYKVMIQAAGRIDRMNTPYKELHYYHLISPAPIDIAIRKAIMNKKIFNESRYINKKSYK